MPTRRTPHRLLTLITQATLLALAAGAQAQTAPPQRVEVTGSAIKRLDTETALPVQVITREDIVKAGATTAAEIMASSEPSPWRIDRNSSASNTMTQSDRPTTGSSCA